MTADELLKANQDYQAVLSRFTHLPPDTIRALNGLVDYLVTIERCPFLKFSNGLTMRRDRMMRCAVCGQNPIEIAHGTFGLCQTCDAAATEILCVDDASELIQAARLHDESCAEN